jgi:hypothetical protein
MAKSISNLLNETDQLLNRSKSFAWFFLLS